MQNIHIKRYDSNIQEHCGTIEPEDRSWILFIHPNNKPQLYFGVKTVGPTGDTEHYYVPANVVEQVENGDEVPRETLYKLGLRVRGNWPNPEAEALWKQEGVPAGTKIARDSLMTALANQ